VEQRRPSWRPGAASAAVALVLTSVLAPEATAYDMETRDYVVPTRHGLVYLEVVHPVDGEGNVVTAPEILTYSPYSGALGRNGDASRWVPRGYARATADLVGTGNSGGCWDYGGRREKESGYDLVEWIAAQPWSTGRVAMMGGSYEGTTATATAVTAPPHLATIVPEAAISRWYEYAYSGGIRYSLNNERPTDEGLDTPLAFDFGLAIPPPLDVADPTWADRVASTIVPCDELAHTSHGYDNETPDYDAFWLERDYVVDAARIRIPVLLAHNWGDWNVKQEEAINLYRALAGTPVKRLYMGSRYRGHGRPSIGYAATVDAWLDHYLLGVPNGVPDSVPEVTSEMADDNGPLGNYAGPWPVTTDVTLFAQEDRADPDYVWKLLPSSPRSPKLPKSAVFSFTTGTNTEATVNVNPRANGQWLWFETDPLARDVRVFGNVEVRLWSTIAREWITYTPTIVDIDPADRIVGPGQLLATASTRIPSVTRAWLDSRYRNGLSSPVLVKPGESFGMRIVAKPQDYTFRRGHLIGLAIQTEVLEWNLPKPYAACTTAACASVRIDWELGKTRLVLPVVDAPADPASLFGPR
jgi:X-Pro dipeptidyl-peptidase